MLDATVNIGETLGVLENQSSPISKRCARGAQSVAVLLDIPAHSTAGSFDGAVEPFVEVTAHWKNQLSGVRGS